MRLVCINNKKHNGYKLKLIEGKVYEAKIVKPDYLKSGLQMFELDSETNGLLSFYDDINFDTTFIKTIMMGRYHGDLDFLASLYFCSENEFRDRKINTILCS